MWKDTGLQLDKLIFSFCLGSYDLPSSVFFFFSTYQQCQQLWKLNFRHLTSYPCNTYFTLTRATKSLAYKNVQSSDSNTLHYPSPPVCACFPLFTSIDLLYLHYDTSLQFPLSTKLQPWLNPSIGLLLFSSEKITHHADWSPSNSNRYSHPCWVYFSTLGIAASNLLSFAWLVFFFLSIPSFLAAVKQTWFNISHLKSEKEEEKKSKHLRSQLPIQLLPTLFLFTAFL